MSEDSEHQLDDSDFGIRGIEKEAGYSPLPLAHVVEKPDDISTDSTMTEHELSHLRRPEPPAPVERDFYDPQSGERRPERETVSSEDAAASLSDAREQERAAREQLAQDDLRSALDQTEQSPQQPAQQTEQQPVDEIQPEQVDAAQEAVAKTWEEADQQISEFLKNPHIRERVEAEFSQVKAQAAEAVNAARVQYDAAISQLGQEIGVVTAALIPEIQGMSPEQAQGALGVLARTNPQRFEQIQQFSNKIQGAVNLTQQQAHARAQQQALIAEAQQKQATEAFQRYAAEQDAKAFAKETPESLAQIRNFLYADAEKAGISRSQLEQTWNSTPALRNAFTSELVADGVRWRMAQRGLAQHRHNPIKPVQRPGTSVAGPRVHEGDLAAASARFNLPGGNEGTQGLKNAAAWITARRGGR